VGALLFEDVQRKSNIETSKSETMVVRGQSMKKGKDSRGTSKSKSKDKKGKGK
jgi:hypothetical protein